MIFDPSDFAAVDFDSFYVGDLTGFDGVLPMKEEWSVQNCLALVQSELEPDFSDLSDTTTETSKSTTPQRKKQKVDKTSTPANITYNTTSLPPVVKTDQRRLYTAMFTNTLNSLDFSLFLTFLAKYSSHDFTYSQTYNGNNVSNIYTHPKLIQLQGVQSVAQYWFNKLQVVPDVAYSLLNTKVHTWDNTECSKVVGTINVSATRVFEVTHATLVNIGTTYHADGRLIQEHSTDSSSATTITKPTRRVNKNKRKKSSTSSSSASSSSSPAYNPAIDDIIIVNSASDSSRLPVDMSAINTTSIAQYLQTAPLAAPPIQRFLTIKLTMHLDANKRIHKMDFQVTPRDVVPLEIVYN